MGKALSYKQILTKQFFREMYGDQSGELVFEYCSFRCLTVVTALSVIHGHEVKWSAVSRETDYLSYSHLSSSGKNISVMVTKKNKSFY